MSNAFLANRSYKAVQKDMMSDKAIELRVFMSVTAQLKALDKADRNYFVKLSDAIIDNLKLWKIVFIDLVDPKNPLPMDLKNQLLGLSEFTETHSRKVLLSEAEPDVLVDINNAIIGGLRQSLANKTTEAA